MVRPWIEQLGLALASRAARTCSLTPQDPRTAAVVPVTPPAPCYFDVPDSAAPPLRVEAGEVGRGYRVEHTWLPASVPAELRETPLALDPVEVIHYRPEPAPDTPAPLVLMSPILGNTVLLVDAFARTLARAGIHAVIVQRKELDFHPEASIQVAEEEVRLLVLRSRQALDHVLTYDDVDAERLGTFGISAGGVVSTLVAGAESRFRAHVWMLAGGPLPDVLIDTVEDRFRGYAREILRTTPRTRDQLRRELRGIMWTDPLRMAASIDPSTVLLVLARFDRSVPYRYGIALWKALGRPERIISPLGHYSTFLLLPWLQARTLERFQRAFQTS